MVDVAVLLAEGLRAQAGGERGVAQLREDAELLLVTNDAARVEDATRGVQHSVAEHLGRGEGKRGREDERDESWRDEACGCISGGG